MGEGLIGQVAKSKESVLITDASNDPRVVHHSDPSLSIRSIIVAPVLFKGELLAVLAVTNPSDGLAFTPTDRSLVESLAEQVGLAVHNATRSRSKSTKQTRYGHAASGESPRPPLPNTHPQTLPYKSLRDP